MKEQIRYSVAVYGRISKYDDIRSGKSISITSQRNILGQYVKDNGWRVYDFYVDDGYSGTNLADV